MFLTRKFFLVCLAILLPTGLPASSTDRDQPISVEADSLEIRDQDNISIYQGKVSLEQGSLDISSDRLEIHFNDANDLVKMEMTGSPARLRQLDDKQLEMVGEARQIEYLESGSILLLTGSARFSHDGNTVTSDWIRIDTTDNSIQASSKSGDRVKMTIQAPKPKGTAE